MAIFKEATKNLINLSRHTKTIILITVDIGLCLLCTWFAFYLRLEKFIKINNDFLFSALQEATILSALISITLAIPIFWLSGLYKTMFLMYLEPY